MGSNQIPVHQSSLCPRSPELRSGHALETESGGLGMESTPQVVNLVWQRFGQVEVDLFVLSMTTHCLLWFSLSSPLPLCLDTLSHRWPRTSLYVFPPIRLSPVVLLRVQSDSEHLLLVAHGAHPVMVFEPGQFVDRPSLGGSP